MAAARPSDASELHSINCCSIDSISSLLSSTLSSAATPQKRPAQPLNYLLFFIKEWVSFASLLCQLSNPTITFLHGRTQPKQRRNKRSFMAQLVSIWRYSKDNSKQNSRMKQMIEFVEWVVWRRWPAGPITRNSIHSHWAAKNKQTPLALSFRLFFSFAFHWNEWIALGWK